METVEMDLMQAQIGSLATDVSRLEARVTDSTKSKTIVITNEDIKDVTPISVNSFSFDMVDDALKDKIFNAVKSGNTEIYMMMDMRPLGGSQIKKAYYSSADYLNDEPTILSFDTMVNFNEDTTKISNIHITIYASSTHDGYLKLNEHV